MSHPNSHMRLCRRLIDRVPFGVALTLPCLALLLVPLRLEAQEGSSAPDQSEERRDLRGDELRERIPAVTGHLILKGGRHELTPIGNVSIADAFRRKYMGSLAYTYHVGDYFAFTGRGGYTFLMTDAGAVDVCDRRAGCQPPSEEELDSLPGSLNLVAGVLGEFSPVYGKINLLAERVLHFDMYLTAGLGLSHYSLRRMGEDASGIGPAMLLGVGQRYFLNHWIAVRLEVLDVLYLQPTGKKDNQLQNEFLFTLGVSLFFPSTFTHNR